MSPCDMESRSSIMAFKGKCYTVKSLENERKHRDTNRKDLENVDERNKSVMSPCDRERCLQRNTVIYKIIAERSDTNRVDLEQEEKCSIFYQLRGSLKNSPCHLRQLSK